MTTVVTKDRGATAKPVGALYVEPPLQVSDAGSETALVDEPLDAAFVVDFLSACLAHERCGVQLYRSVGGRTALDELRTGYQKFGGETMRHVEILEDLISQAGGNPSYVSPAARATEGAAAAILESTYLTSGSVDPIVAELSMLEAVVLAETKDLANWKFLAALTDQMTDGDLANAFSSACDEVLAQEMEHEQWAAEERERLLFMLATGGRTISSSGNGAPLTRDELYQQARDLDINGRSQMTKEELAEAVMEEIEGEDER